MMQKKLHGMVALCKQSKSICVMASMHNGGEQCYALFLQGSKCGIFVVQNLCDIVVSTFVAGYHKSCWRKMDAKKRKSINLSWPGVCKWWTSTDSRIRNQATVPWTWWWHGIQKSTCVAWCKSAMQRRGRGTQQQSTWWLGPAGSWQVTSSKIEKNPVWQGRLNMFLQGQN